jgi:hypothetical protein
LPPILGDGEDGFVDVVEDGKIIRSRLKEGKLIRDPEPVPVYHIDCFHTAFGKPGDEPKPQGT